MTLDGVGAVLLGDAVTLSCPEDSRWWDRDAGRLQRRLAAVCRKDAKENFFYDQVIEGQKPRLWNYYPVSNPIVNRDFSAKYSRVASVSMAVGSCTTGTPADQNVLKTFDRICPTIGWESVYCMYTVTCRVRLISIFC